MLKPKVLRPKVGDIISTVLSSSPRVDARTGIISYPGELSKAPRIERKIALIYVDGRIKDDCGDVWYITKTDKPNVWRATD